MPGPFPEDRDLLQRVAAGEDAAFSSFYRAHLDAVVAFFRRRVPDAELAFDLAAETFAAVVISAGSYGGDGPAAAWLYGIARNKLRESLRRGRVEHDARRRLGLEPVVLDDRDLERVEDRALAGADALARELAALPDPTRRALLARVVEERAYDEIAAHLDCSEQVVRQRVHRGLTRVRAGLKEER
jgi:RNA polymerase sigma factor (sigma-70 family)